MEWILMLADLTLLSLLFCWFMCRNGTRKYRSFWPYVLGYLLFAGCLLGCMFIMYDGIRCAILLLMTVLLQFFLFEKRAKDFFFCICYTLGIILCQLLSVNVSHWIYSSITTINFISIGIQNPLEALNLVNILFKLFLEITWTFLLTGIRRKQGEEPLERKQTIYFFLFPLCTAFFMISLAVSSDVYVLRYGFGLLIFNFILCFCMNIFALYFFRMVQKGHKAERESRLYCQEKELVYKHYLQLEENYQVSRKVIHDAKNHMQAMARLYESGDTKKAEAYASEVFHLLNQTGHMWYTDHKMLNIILNEKLNYAVFKDAKVELDIESEPLTCLRDIDVTTIFANLLDNAAEAIGSKEDKFLQMQVKKVQSFLMIKIVNSIGEEKDMSETTPRHQGLGLKNVRSAIKAYHGTMKMKEENKQFCVVIMLPDESVDIKEDKKEERV